MRAIVYMLQTGWKNWFRKNLRRPGFYCYIAFLAFYVWMIANSITNWTKGGNDRPEIFVMALTALHLYLSPINYKTYASRKGLRFLPAHVHMMFSAPLPPKLLLVFGSLQTFSVGFLMELVVVLAGIFQFHIPVGKMLLYFLISGVFSTIIDFALVICLYGNERFSEKTMTIIGKAFWLVLLGMIVVTVGYFYLHGFSLARVLEFLLSTWICYIPVFGWQISAIRLVILGAGTAEIIGTICFFLYGIVLTVLAIRMSCTGDYYEDAMKFADDYQKIVDKRKKGDTSMGAKWLKSHRDAQVVYRGSGARAIFYRYLLEYKKSKFFLFGVSTLVYLAVGAGLVILHLVGKIPLDGNAAYYALFGILAYMLMIFGQLQTKWERELENPYIFMIPAGAFSKIFYATCLEHVKTACETLLVIVPYTLVFGLPAYYIPVALVIAVAAKAVKIYADTLIVFFIGNRFGATARQFLRMFIEWTLIGIAVLVGLAGQIFIGPVAALLGAAGYLILTAGLLLVMAAAVFEHVEYQAG